MRLAEAKTYEGQTVSLTWVNRKGEEVCEAVDVYEVTFVPMYGPCLVTDVGNVSIDRVVTCATVPALRRAA